MKNFISASETNRRFAAEHSELIDDAVEKIVRLMREARQFPVLVPRTLLTDVPCVRHELLRKLRMESGWEVIDDPARLADPEVIELYFPPMRREEQHKK